jgi:hypothetical protein
MLRTPLEAALASKPKSIEKHLKEKDWAGPIVNVIHAAYLLFLDAVQIGVLFGIATGLDELLEHLHVKPIELERFNLTIEATEIIKNFDYMLLLMFLIALIVRFWTILRAE